MLNEILPKIRLLPELKIPIINVSLPEIEIPPFPKPLPKLDDRQREVLRYALMDDLADVIPFAGDVASDMAYAELKRLMKPEEYNRFVEYNKWLPSVLAALKVFSE